MIADDERPARSFLDAMLRSFEDVEIVGEGSNGIEAVKLIERKKPDLAQCSGGSAGGRVLRRQAPAYIS